MYEVAFNSQNHMFYIMKNGERVSSGYEFTEEHIARRDAHDMNMLGTSKISDEIEQTRKALGLA